MNTVLCLMIFLLVVSAEDRLLKVITLVRHGHRNAFNKYVPMNTVNKEDGFLTDIGAQQLEQLGRWNQKIYSNFLDLYDGQPGVCKKEKIQAIFSCSQRTILSGLNYLKGLCSENYDEVLPYILEHNLVPSIKDQKAQNFLTSTIKFEDLFALSDYLATCEDDNDWFFHASRIPKCPYIRNEYNDIWQSYTFQNQFNKFKAEPEYDSILSKIKKILDTQFEPTKDESQDIYDAIYLKEAWSSNQCYLYAGLQSPFEWNAKELSFMYRFSTFIYYHFENGNQKVRSIKTSWFLQTLKQTSMDLMARNSRLLIEEAMPDTHVMQQAGSAPTPTSEAPLPQEQPETKSEEAPRTEDYTEPSPQDSSVVVEQTADNTSSGSGTSETASESQPSAAPATAPTVSVTSSDEASTETSTNTPSDSEPSTEPIPLTEPPAPSETNPVTQTESSDTTPTQPGSSSTTEQSPVPQAGSTPESSSEQTGTSTTTSNSSIDVTETQNTESSSPTEVPDSTATSVATTSTSNEPVTSSQEETVASSSGESVPSAQPEASASQPETTVSQPSTVDSQSSTTASSVSEPSSPQDLLPSQQEDSDTESDSSDDSTTQPESSESSITTSSSTETETSVAQSSDTTALSSASSPAESQASTVSSESNETSQSSSEQAQTSTSEPSQQSSSSESSESQPSSDDKKETLPFTKDIIPQLQPEGITLFAGHDSTMIALLSTFQTEQELASINRLPNFGAQISFEFIEKNPGDIYVQIRYNQKVLKTFNQCKVNESQCQLAEFVNILDKYIIENVKQVCQNQ